MKPMESLVSLATAVVVAGDDMKSQRWCTPTAGGGRPFAYSALCGRLSMLKSRGRFSLLDQTPGERTAIHLPRICSRVGKARNACLMARAGDHAIAPARLAISASIQA